jgi:hypothetical protein
MRLLAALAAAAALAAPPPAAAGVEEDLARRWEGAWVVVRPAVASACTSLYTNNDVRGDLTVGRGEHRFAAGELARVEGIDLHRGKVDVLLDLGEPVLAARRDGPFTLYDELSCRVELVVPRPAGADTLAPLDALLAGLLERHPDAAGAKASAAWNRRRRDPYPADYEATLAAYGKWKAEQVNAAVGARREEALAEAARLLDGYGDHPDYQAGFAAGVEAARDEGFGGCESLLDASPYAFGDSPPSGTGQEWRRGFRDGQALVFWVEVGHRLGRCFVPVP